MNTVSTKINFVHKIVDKDAQTVVFIHGWMDSMEDSTKNYQKLFKEGYNILRFDLPGHGGSEKLNEYSLEIYENSIISLIDSLPIGRVIIIGHSMGAVLALRLQKRMEDYIDKIILIDPPLGRFPFIIKAFIPILLLLQKIGLLDMSLGFIRNSNVFQNFWSDMFVGKASPNTQEAREVTIKGIKDVDIKAVSRGVMDTLGDKMIALPKERSIGTFIIYGENDPVIEIKHIPSLFLKNNVYVVKDEKHTPNRTSSIEFNNAVLDFVKSNN